MATIKPSPLRKNRDYPVAIGISSPPADGGQPWKQQDSLGRTICGRGNIRIPCEGSDKQSATPQPQLQETTRGVQSEQQSQPSVEKLYPGLPKGHPEPWKNTKPYWKMSREEFKQNLQVFKTAQGSVYIYSNGQTVRVKPIHEGHERTDVGLKRASNITYFVNPDKARELGMWQGMSGEGKRILVQGDEIILTSLNANTGKRGIDGRMKYDYKPTEGKSPIELFERSSQGPNMWRGNHPGNTITELGKPTDGDYDFFMEAAKTAGYKSLTTWNGKSLASRFGFHKSLHIKSIKPSPFATRNDHSKQTSKDHHNKLKVRIIDGHAFRNQSPENQEYGLWAVHHDYKVIPVGEIWIDDQSDPKDRPFFLANATAYIDKLKANKDESIAYEYGVMVEESEREKSAGGMRPRHDEIPKDVYIEKWRTINDQDEKVDVWIVDGLKVRNMFKTDWHSGGHAFVYPWIPRNEIWLARALNDKERELCLLHESTERRLMKNEEKDYDDAHDIASRAEWQARQKGAKANRKSTESKSLPDIFAERLESDYQIKEQLCRQAKESGHSFDRLEQCCKDYWSGCETKSTVLNIDFALRQAIEQAATETDRDPTLAQKEAGTYKKGRFKIHGMTVAIENPVGSTRSGIGKDGKPWSVIMKSHYGYFITPPGSKRKIKGSDGEALDVFIGPHPESETIFVVDQLDESGKFDELKCLIAFDNVAEAKAAYQSNYAPGWKGFGGITPMSWAEFKEFVEHGNAGRQVRSDVSETSGTPRTTSLAGVSGLATDEGEMPEHSQQGVSSVRSPRDKSMQGMVGQFSNVLQLHGTEAGRAFTGEEGQRWGLLPEQLHMGNGRSTVTEQTEQQMVHLQGGNADTARLGEEIGYSKNITSRAIDLSELGCRTSVYNTTRRTEVNVNNDYTEREDANTSPMVKGVENQQSGVPIPSTAGVVEGRSIDDPAKSLDSQKKDVAKSIGQNPIDDTESLLVRRPEEWNKKLLAGCVKGGMEGKPCDERPGVTAASSGCVPNKAEAGPKTINDKTDIPKIESNIKPSPFKKEPKWSGGKPPYQMTNREFREFYSEKYRAAKKPATEVKVGDIILSEVWKKTGFFKVEKIYKTGMIIGRLLDEESLEPTDDIIKLPATQITSTRERGFREYGKEPQEYRILDDELLAVRSSHADLVRKAIAEGKEVPAEVKAELEKHPETKSFGGFKALSYLNESVGGAIVPPPKWAGPQPHRKAIDRDALAELRKKHKRKPPITAILAVPQRGDMIGSVKGLPAYIEHRPAGWFVVSPESGGDQSGPWPDRLSAESWAMLARFNLRKSMWLSPFAHRKSINNYHIKGSYLAECPRDKTGHCKPRDEADETGPGKRSAKIKPSPLRNPLQGDQEIKKSDIRDAKKVLKDYSFEYGIKWGNHDIDAVFDEAVKNAKIEKLPIEKLHVHHDWGRRPKLGNPIIVAQTASGEYIILDGQHRVLTTRDAGKNDINALVLKLPLRRGMKRHGRAGPLFYDPDLEKKSLQQYGGMPSYDKGLPAHIERRSAGWFVVSPESGGDQSGPWPDRLTAEQWATLARFNLRKSLWVSPFLGRKQLSSYWIKGSYLATCPRDESGHCLPQDEADRTGQGKDKDNNNGKRTASESPIKRRAEAGKLMSAKREGKGKDAKVLLSNGQPAPKHITPAMIPPAWKKVKVSLDPDADVQVTAVDAKGRSKIVYHEKFIANNQAAKFARVIEGLNKAEEMADQNQQNRQNPELAEVADCTWLMMEQATRPGSDADTKGFAELYGKPVTENNVVVKKDKKGKVSMALQFGDKKVPVKDDGTKKEIMRRLESGESLEDSTYWLKSFGATTLEGRHVVEADDGIRLKFQGKEGVWHDHLIRDKGLATMLKERKVKAGDKDKLFAADYDAVAKYVHSLDGGSYSPKDLRTMKATKIAIAEIDKVKDCCPSAESYKKAVMQVAERASSLLGNRPEQCLVSYIAPEVFGVWKNPTKADTDA